MYHVQDVTKTGTKWGESIALGIFHEQSKNRILAHWGFNKKRYRRTFIYVPECSDSINQAIQAATACRHKASELIQEAHVIKMYVMTDADKILLANIELRMRDLTGSSNRNNKHKHTIKRKRVDIKQVEEHRDTECIEEVDADVDTISNTSTMQLIGLNGSKSCIGTFTLGVNCNITKQ